MLSVDEARERVLKGVQPLAPIELPLLESHGCVLAADVVAQLDVPAFSAAAADGYALRAKDIESARLQAPVSLRLVGRVAAGRAPGVTIGWGEAARIAAGGPMPAGADCVVALEHCRAERESVAVARAADEGALVRPAGGDVKAGEVLVPAGRRLSWPELGAMAGAGHSSPLVFPKVRVAVLSIGDQLVEPDRPLPFGLAHEASSYGVFGALRDAGAIPYRLGIVAESRVEETVLANLARADCFVTAIGTSDEDVEPERLRGLLPVECVDVAMHPGASHGFGVFQGTPFFALSGNPVSAFVTFEALVRPAILRMMGRRDMARPEVRAVVEGKVAGPSGVTRFVPAFVEHREGAWRARPMQEGAADLLGAMVRSNGLIVVPGDSEAASGGEVRVRIFRPLER